MGTEESIIYSYDLATVPSVLPAFANAKDIIVCDEVTCRSGPPFVSLCDEPASWGCHVKDTVREGS